MSPYIALGMMKAEFEEACRAIDTRADEAVKENLQSAFKALLAGNPSERDRLCNKAESAGLAVAKAKTEAWYRIGEKHGLSREQATAALERITQ